MSRTIGAGVLVAVVLFGAGIRSQGKVTPTFRQILQSYDLGHLRVEDMGKIEDLLDGMNKASTGICRDKAEELDSVLAYLKTQGWQEERVVLGRRDDRWVLVAGGQLAFLRYTADLPLIFDISGFRNGIHFVRKGAFGDIAEMIVGEKIESLQFATWKPFRP